MSRQPICGCLLPFRNLVSSYYYGNQVLEAEDPSGVTTYTYDGNAMLMEIDGTTPRPKPPLRRKLPMELHRSKNLLQGVDC